jgi:hypothetical protein
MIVSGVLVLASYPALRGFGRLPDNPSLLPRNYTAGLTWALLVWAVTVLGIAAKLRKRRAKTIAGRHVEEPTHDDEPREEAR